MLPTSYCPALLLLEIIHLTFVPVSLLLVTHPASAGRAALRVLVVAPNHNQCWGHIYTSRGIWVSLRSFGPCPGWVCAGLWLEPLGEYRSRQGKWQTGMALGHHWLQGEQESSAPFPYMSLDPKIFTLRGADGPERG